jgi:hypothetical protein
MHYDKLYCTLLKQARVCKTTFKWNQHDSSTDHVGLSNIYQAVTETKLLEGVVFCRKWKKGQTVFPHIRDYRSWGMKCKSTGMFAFLRALLSCTFLPNLVQENSTPNRFQLTMQVWPNHYLVLRWREWPQWKRQCIQFTNTANTENDGSDSIVWCVERSGWDSVKGMGAESKPSNHSEMRAMENDDRDWHRK